MIKLLASIVLLSHSSHDIRLLHLLQVSVLVEIVALQPDDDGGHDGLDDAELAGDVGAEVDICEG